MGLKILGRLGTHLNYIFSRKKIITKKCVPALPKIFRPVTQNTLIFFIWPSNPVVMILDK